MSSTGPLVLCAHQLSDSRRQLILSASREPAPWEISGCAASRARVLLGIVCSRTHEEFSFHSTVLHCKGWEHGVSMAHPRPVENTHGPEGKRHQPQTEVDKRTLGHRWTSDPAPLPSLTSAQGTWSHQPNLSLLCFPCFH